MPAHTDVWPTLGIHFICIEAADWNGDHRIWDVCNLCDLLQSEVERYISDQLCTTIRFKELRSVNEIDQASLAKMLARNQQEGHWRTSCTELHEATDANERHATWAKTPSSRFGGDEPRCTACIMVPLRTSLRQPCDSILQLWHLVASLNLDQSTSLAFVFFQEINDARLLAIHLLATLQLQLIDGALDVLAIALSIVEHHGSDPLQLALHSIHHNWFRIDHSCNSSCRTLFAPACLNPPTLCV